MKQILMIEVSPRGKDLASRSVTDTLAARLTGLHASAKLIRRDLASEDLPPWMILRSGRYRRGIRPKRRG